MRVCGKCNLASRALRRRGRQWYDKERRLAHAPGQHSPRPGSARRYLIIQSGLHFAINNNLRESRYLLLSKHNTQTRLKTYIISGARDVLRDCRARFSRPQTYLPVIIARPSLLRPFPITQRLREMIIAFSFRNRSKAKHLRVDA